MADTKRLRRHGSRAAAGIGGLILGLALAGPAYAAEPPTTSSSSSTSTSTSTSSSTSTSTSTSSTTTSTTVAPPPVTSPVTSSVIPPLVQDRDSRSEIGDSLSLDRSRAARARAGRGTPNTGPELPFTGDGTLAIFGSGLAALMLGALALWWGSRDQRGIDAPGPEATG